MQFQHLKVGKRGSVVKNGEIIVLLHVWVNLLVFNHLIRKERDTLKLFNDSKTMCSSVFSGSLEKFR